MQFSYLSSSPFSSSILPGRSDDLAMIFCILGLDYREGSEEEKTILFLYDIFNPTSVVSASDILFATFTWPLSYEEFLGVLMVLQPGKAALAWIWAEEIGIAGLEIAAKRATEQVVAMLERYCSSNKEQAVSHVER